MRDYIAPPLFLRRFRVGFLSAHTSFGLADLVRRFGMARLDHPPLQTPLLLVWRAVARAEQRFGALCERELVLLSFYLRNVRHTALLKCFAVMHST